MSDGAPLAVGVLVRAFGLPIVGTQSGLVRFINGCQLSEADKSDRWLWVATANHGGVALSGLLDFDGYLRPGQCRSKPKPFNRLRQRHSARVPLLACPIAPWRGWHGRVAPITAFALTSRLLAPTADQALPSNRHRGLESRRRRPCACPTSSQSTFGFGRETERAFCMIQ